MNSLKLATLHELLETLIHLGVVFMNVSRFKFVLLDLFAGHRMIFRKQVTVSHVWLGIQSCPRVICSINRVVLLESTRVVHVLFLLDDKVTQDNSSGQCMAHSQVQFRPLSQTHLEDQ